MISIVELDILQKKASVRIRTHGLRRWSLLYHLGYRDAAVSYKKWNAAPEFKSFESRMYKKLAHAQ